MHGANPRALVEPERRAVAAPDLEGRQAAPRLAAARERVVEQRRSDAGAPAIRVRRDRQDVDLTAARLGIWNDPVVAEPDDRRCARGAGDVDPRQLAAEL